MSTQAEEKSYNVSILEIDYLCNQLEILLDVTNAQQLKTNWIQIHSLTESIRKLFDKLVVTFGKKLIENKKDYDLIYNDLANCNQAFKKAETLIR